MLVLLCTELGQFVIPQSEHVSHTYIIAARPSFSDTKSDFVHADIQFIVTVQNITTLSVNLFIQWHVSSLCQILLSRTNCNNARLTRIRSVGRMRFCSLWVCTGTSSVFSVRISISSCHNWCTNHVSPKPWIYLSEFEVICSGLASTHSIQQPPHSSTSIATISRCFALYNYTALPVDSDCGPAERHPTPRPGSLRPSGVEERLAVGEVGQAVTPCAEGFVCQQVELRKSRCVHPEERGMYTITKNTTNHSLVTILKEDQQVYAVSLQGLTLVSVPDPRTWRRVWYRDLDLLPRGSKTKW